MALRQSLLALGAMSLAVACFTVPASGGGPGSGRDRDDDDRTARIIERAERDAARVAERADEQAARFAEERTRIAERAIEEPDKAAEDLAKLETDIREEEAKIAEDAAKIEEDRAEDLRKEQEDLLKDLEDAERDDAKLASGDRDGASDVAASARFHDLAAAESAEHDESGFPVRRGEVAAIGPSDQLVARAEGAGFRTIERRALPQLGTELVRFQGPAGLSAIAARDSFRSLDEAAVVDVVHYYGLNTAGASPPRPTKASMPAPRKGPKLVVGVIDTAIARHASLGGVRVIPWDKGNTREAPAGHGTAVASLVASQGSGVIYSANIFRGPASRPFTSADVIAEALEWMLGQDVQTINMSLAGPRSAILDRLVRQALSRGRSIVAAAGNDGPVAPPSYPAAVPGVIAVTAVDRNLSIYRYANRGRYIAVAAQGVDVVAALHSNRFALYSGTSFAAPVISGWIARCRARGGSATSCRDKLQEAARDLGDKGFDEIFGFGYVG